MKTHNFPLGDVVEHDEVAEHRDEADQAQPGHYVDDCVLQTEFTWQNIRFNKTKIDFPTFSILGHIVHWNIFIRQDYPNIP